jgi:hypothetical protein
VDATIAAKTAEAYSPVIEINFALVSNNPKCSSPRQAIGMPDDRYISKPRSGTVDIL